jgi:hypothetical protein
MSLTLLASYISKILLERTVLPVSHGKRMLASSEFSHWFSGSRVVDDQNVPLMVVHATTKDFDKFDGTTLNNNTGISTNFLGFYFTDSPETADTYISKKFDSNKGFRPSGSYKLFFLKIKNPYHISQKDYWRLAKMSEKEIERYVVFLKSKGFDGIIMPSVWRGDPQGKDYVIFDESQARNALSQPLGESRNRTEKTTQWDLPSADEEREEISRTSDELNINYEPLWEAFANHEGELITLSDELWNKLENTDIPKDFEEAKRLATEYDKNYEPIVKAYKNNKSLPAPMVIIQQNGIPYLVAGNTRLMFAKALGIRPKVYLLDLRKHYYLYDRSEED